MSLTTLICEALILPKRFISAQISLTRMKAMSAVYCKQDLICSCIKLSPDIHTASPIKQYMPLIKPTCGKENKSAKMYIQTKQHCLRRCLPKVNNSIFSASFSIFVPIFSSMPTSTVSLGPQGSGPSSWKGGETLFNGRQVHIF